MTSKLPINLNALLRQRSAPRGTQFFIGQYDVSPNSHICNMIPQSGFGSSPFGRAGNMTQAFAIPTVQLTNLQPPRQSPCLQFGEALADLHKITVHRQIKCAGKKRGLSDEFELSEMQGIEFGDAMGCQKDIAAKIVDRGGNYVIGVRAISPRCTTPSNHFSTTTGETATGSKVAVIDTRQSNSAEGVRLHAITIWLRFLSAKWCWKTGRAFRPSGW